MNKALEDGLWDVVKSHVDRFHTDPYTASHSLTKLAVKALEHANRNPPDLQMAHHSLREAEGWLAHYASIGQVIEHDQISIEGER